MRRLGDDLDGLIEGIIVDASGEDEQLSSFRQAFEEKQQKDPDFKSKVEKDREQRRQQVDNLENMTVAKLGSVLIWTIDGLKIATVTNVTFTSSNIFIGYWDSFSSLSDDTNLTFAIVDNVRVEAPVVAALGARRANLELGTTRAH